jgi:hypothetical protein
MSVENTINEKYVKQTLDLLIAEKRFALEGFALQNLSVDKIPSLIERELLYSLHTLIPAENMKEETHTFNFEYPLTWWQSLKEQYFPSWLKRRFPVRYKKITKTVKFTAYNIYPKGI